jgi:hypothetical protein
MIRSIAQQSVICSIAEQSVIRSIVEQSMIRTNNLFIVSVVFTLWLWFMNLRSWIGVNKHVEA